MIAKHLLLAFILPSPKRQDLFRNGLYTMHTIPTGDNDDALVITGRTQPVSDPAVVTAAREIYLAARRLTEAPPEFETEELFEFRLDSALLTKTRGGGDRNPQHRIWRFRPREDATPQMLPPPPMPERSWGENPNKSSGSVEISARRLMHLRRYEVTTLQMSGPKELKPSSG